MTPAVLPQLVANGGARVLRAAIAEPDRYACEPTGAEGEWRRRTGRSLTAAELDRLLQRYSGDP